MIQWMNRRGEPIAGFDLVGIEYGIKEKIGLRNIGRRTLRNLIIYHRVLVREPLSDVQLEMVVSGKFQLHKFSRLWFGPFVDRLALGTLRCGQAKYFWVMPGHGRGQGAIVVEEI